MVYTYDQERDTQGRVNRERRESGRDIAPIPAIVNPDRRRRGELFRDFCDLYFPNVFELNWSEDHLKVIAKIERATIDGGRFAVAMPRGSGKTTLCERACIWSLLYGYRRFIMLVGSDESAAASMLDTIKTELETNDLLAEDFPESVYPIRRLDGIAHRCNGQLLNGQRTHIEWTAKQIVLPTVPGSDASGGIVQVAGITGRIRGAKYQRADGHTARPDLVIIDDPQTDESARSPSQCQTRLSIVNGAILGLAGPGKKIAAIMPCTVIREGDMIDKVLDATSSPEWQGERCQLVYTLPTNMDLWEKYNEHRKESLRERGDTTQATEFYQSNREAMDEGAVVGWDERKNPDDLSALQYAMNLLLQDKYSFWAEYQNRPLVDDPTASAVMSSDEICEKLSGVPRKIVPPDVTRLTAFVDVQQTLLYWMVCGWSESFTGYVIDYGSFPRQAEPYFTLADAKRTMQLAYPGMPFEPMLLAALGDLTNAIVGRQWMREDETGLSVERLMIDANWGVSTDIVYEHCRGTPHGGVVMPSHGKGYTATGRSINTYKLGPGDRMGPSWRIPKPNKRQIRHCLFDTNYWKTFIHGRLAAPIGSKGCLTLYGTNPSEHRMVADHWRAEFPVKVEARGRTVEEWKMRPSRDDNHLLDCIVGCAVGASTLGISVAEGANGFVSKPVKRVRLSELQRAR